MAGFEVTLGGWFWVALDTPIRNCSYGLFVMLKKIKDLLLSKTMSSTNKSPQERLAFFTEQIDKSIKLLEDLMEVSAFKQAVRLDKSIESLDIIGNFLESVLTRKIIADVVELSTICWWIYIYMGEVFIKHYSGSPKLDQKLTPVKI